jgi:hypothetical protein
MRAANGCSIPFLLRPVQTLPVRRRNYWDGGIDYHLRLQYRLPSASPLIALFSARRGAGLVGQDLEAPPRRQSGSLRCWWWRSKPGSGACGRLPDRNDFTRYGAETHDVCAVKADQGHLGGATTHRRVR